MNRIPLLLLVGKSASGKTTLATLLETRLGLRQLQSYTTRAPRFDMESGHTFVSDKEFDALTDIVAYTEYNGNRYCTTKEQLDNSDIYVIDVDGVDYLLRKYNTDRKIIILYFNTSVITRIKRMQYRGDSDAQIISRILNDEEFDWYNELEKLVGLWECPKVKDLELVEIDADNFDANEMYEYVEKIIKETGVVL